MAKIEEGSNVCRGLITSLAVLRTHRELRLPTKLMIAIQIAMEKGVRCRVHVRKSNLGAFKLYTKRLEYEVLRVDPKYYFDGEDAYYIRKHLNGKQNHHNSRWCSSVTRSIEAGQDSKSDAKASAKSESERKLAV